MVEFGYSTSTAPASNDTGNDASSFPNSFTLVEELPTEPEPNRSGFALINGDTWLPRPLYEARQKEWHRASRKNQNSIIWTK
jgi:hypothetical protein